MDKLAIKHITKTCPQPGCDSKAFVQVVVVGDAETQKKIDAKARAKLNKGLREHHQKGLHD